MLNARSCGALLLFLAASGCASQQDLARVRVELDEAKGRILQAEKELATVRVEAKDEVEKNFRVSRQDMEAMRKGGADLQAALEGVRVDMQLLTGRVEDLALQVKKPAEDIQLLKEDLERRLAAIDDKTLKMARELERIAKEGEKFQSETQKKLAEAAEKAVEQASPDTQYRNAMDALRGGNPVKARELFSRFLAANANHELAANARYWIGETYYEEKKYDKAILEFEEVVKNFPAKEKSAAALLKQAMAFGELGDAASAKFVYRRLAENYPQSEEAKKAKEKLKELK
ncbi:MAG TPA: tol-pal system protein YbgF [Verrucomicrobiae bacterium]|nr:tol-pal system protein YbgF [Verrucomicrobiae bacterium]